MVTTVSTFILIILGNLMLISIPNNILAQLTEQELESIKKEIELKDKQMKILEIQIENETVKIDKQLKLLDAQIEKESVKIENLAELVYILLTNVLPVVATVLVAFITAFLAWRNERKKIPTAEEEKIINEIATNWYYHSHLKVYNNIWNKIQKSDNNKIVNTVWDYLCVKEFPSEDLDDIKVKGFKSVPVKKDIQDYLKKRLNISEKSFHLRIGNDKQSKKDDEIRDRKSYDSSARYYYDKMKEILPIKIEESKKYGELRNRIHLITDASSVSYYDSVRDRLPKVAEIAVLATLGEKEYNPKDSEKVFEESLKKLKRLMIFYRLREDKKVAKIVLRSAVYTNMLKGDKSQITSKDSNNELQSNIDNAI